ncbi:MAG: peptidoglycan-binding domain-containing protein [Pseudomonadota bacterium]|nr:peptidoglycan-binding domain-containing protein [Pseudomonadota bacterium]
MIRPSARRNYLSALAGVLLAGTFAATPVCANEVVALKNALYGAGYEINNVTPEMDAATRSALESYQQSQALMVTGELDAATRESLGIGGVSPAPGTVAPSSTRSSPASAPAKEPQGAAKEKEAEDDGWSFW